MKLEALTADKDGLVVGVGHHCNCSIAGTAHHSAVGHDGCSPEEHLHTGIFLRTSTIQLCLKDCGIAGMAQDNAFGHDGFIPEAHLEESTYWSPFLCEGVAHSKSQIFRPLFSAIGT